MSVINSFRSGVGWISRRNTTVRELIKSAKTQRLSLLSKRRNAQFVKLHPGEPMPPLDLMADGHAHCDYAFYYETGLLQARVYADVFARHFDFAQRAPVQIFEWGCGTGRILRHLRTLYDPAAVVLRGSDCNPVAVEWSARAFPNIPVFRNQLAPPLELDENSIDIAYCNSVFTHLSDDLCRQWITELARIVRPGGLISFTTAGMTFAHRYDESEKEAYLRGIPIYRDWDEVGRRDFFSWHPPQYVRRVFLSNLEELEHISADQSPLKDMWLARVPL